MTIQIIHNVTRPPVRSGPESKWAKMFAQMTETDCLRVVCDNYPHAAYTAANRQGIKIHIVKRNGFYEIWKGANRFTAKTHRLTSDQWQG